MSKRQVLMLFGVLVAILPFLGFPLDWEKVLECIAGLLIVVLSYRLKPEGRPNDPSASSYTEHKSTPTL